ncbi:MAG: ABC transporter transmembrane domain-containing protein, partial [Bacteroidota bacterium]
MDTATEWNDPLPAGFAPEGDVRLCVKADLSPEGLFANEWLVVTGTHLYVVCQKDNTPDIRLELPLAEIKEPRVETLVDGGAFEITRDGDRLELLRFTSSRSPRLNTAAAVLGKWLKDEEAVLPDEEVRRCANCGFPLEKGSRVCPACSPKTRSLRRLIGYMRPHLSKAIALSALSLVGTALTLIPPYLQKPLMDEVLVPRGTPRPFENRVWLLGALVMLLLAARVAGGVVGAFRGWLSSLLGNRLTHDIRSELYQHLHYLSLSFFDKRQLGTVISRVNQDTGQLQQFLVWGAEELTINVLMIVGISVALFMMNYRLALLVLIPVPLVIVFSVTVWPRVRVYMQRFWHRWSRLNAVLNEGLTGLRVVRAFAQEPREVQRFTERSNDLAVTGVQTERMWAIVMAIMMVLMTSGTLLVWYAGGRQVLAAQISLGTLMAFLTYVGMFYGPIQSLSMLLNWSSRSLTAAERVFEVLDSVPEVENAQDATAVPDITGKVEFRDVTFGYDKHCPVLKNISIEVQPGEMIGLVGHSGAGKTTII